jgi:hypothetical protein
VLGALRGNAVLGVDAVDDAFRGVDAVGDALRGVDAVGDAIRGVDAVGDALRGVDAVPVVSARALRLGPLRGVTLLAVDRTTVDPPGAV